MVTIHTPLPHVVWQTPSHVVLLTAKRTRNGDELALASLFPHVQVEVQLLQSPQPETSHGLHWAVHGEGVDAIAQLPIEQSHDAFLLADGAGLAKVLYSADALLAEVVSAAAGEVRVLHDREADWTAAVVWGPLVKTDVKGSSIGWRNCHLWHKNQFTHYTYCRINNSCS